MHYRVLVALACEVAPEGVAHELARVMNLHAEQDGAEWPGQGEWDWWVVGGRWSGMFSLSADAYRRRRAGTLDLPIDGDFDLGGFPDRQISYYDATARIGSALSVETPSGTRELVSPHQTDCARLRDIEPDSVSVPFYWIELDGRLHDLWFDPHRAPLEISDIRRALDSGTPLLDYDRLEEINTRRFHEWFQTLPADTWLINVDAHR